MTEGDNNASTNPMLVVVDEQTGEKYARAISHKGTGDIRDMDWLVKDMALELQCWGHTGGDQGHILVKNDSEPATLATILAATSGSSERGPTEAANSTSLAANMGATRRCDFVKGSGVSSEEPLAQSLES